jgi:hypothetical protein
LDSVVNNSEWYDSQAEPGQTVAGDSQDTKQANKVCQEDIQYERQRVIYGVHVSRQAIQDTSSRRAVIKLQASL